MYRKLLILMLVLGIMTGAAVAQDEDVVATGLNNPRNVFLAADGTLYIAEAGAGGDSEVQGPFGPAAGGLTGQVSAVTADGETAVIVPELVSMDAGLARSKAQPLCTSPKTLLAGSRYGSRGKPVRGQARRVAGADQR
ncbi:MAG: hypothetical protein IPK19_08710 [Chloroflexi bacterium]|nr:hypothetical protein [Chloroflexota bacterium]